MTEQLQFSTEVFVNEAPKQEKKVKQKKKTKMYRNPNGFKSGSRRFDPNIDTSTFTSEQLIEHGTRGKRSKYYYEHQSKERKNKRKSRKNPGVSEREKVADYARHTKDTFRINVWLRIRMFYDQEGLCWICGKPLDPNKNNPMDHDHRCCGKGKGCPKCIRGLCHHKCNTWIGVAEANPELLIFLSPLLNLNHRSPTVQAYINKTLVEFNEIP